MKHVVSALAVGVLMVVAWLGSDRDVAVADETPTTIQSSDGNDVGDLDTFLVGDQKKKKKKGKTSPDELFKKLDTNNDGSLSKAEFEKMFEKKKKKKNNAAATITTTAQEPVQLRAVLVRASQVALRNER